MASSLAVVSRNLRMDAGSSTACLRTLSSVRLTLMPRVQHRCADALLDPLRPNLRLIAVRPLSGPLAPHHRFPGPTKGGADTPIHTLGARYCSGVLNWLYSALWSVELRAPCVEAKYPLICPRTKTHEFVGFMSKPPP
ncbi:unnamed protein product [Scytosiphon promiscuus]